MPSKELKERETAFAEALKEYSEKYERQMLLDFFYYWTEPNKSLTKMRFEMEKTWDTARRLRTWEKNNICWKRGGSAGKPEVAPEKYYSRDSGKTPVINPPPEIKVLNDEQLDNIYRSDIEAFYQRCRSGIVPRAIPDYFKPILVKDGLMKERENMGEVFTKKLSNGIPALYAKIES